MRSVSEGSTLLRSRPGGGAWGGMSWLLCRVLTFGCRCD